jgi:mRNA guanylyltransferase
MRMRDDKPDGNHKSIVDKILQSIRDGVELEAVSVHDSAKAWALADGKLLARADQIRAASKARAAQRQGQPPIPRPAGAPGGAPQAGRSSGGGQAPPVATGGLRR